MPTTTTLKLVRNGAYAVIKALTPGTKADIKYDRPPLEYAGPLREWAQRTGAAAMRVCELRTVGEKIDPGLMDPAAKWSIVECLLTIAYPTGGGLYGLGNLDTDAGLQTIEDVIEADARQLHDAIVSGSNYVAGQQLAEVTVLPPDRGDPLIWFQELRVVFSFFEAQSI